MIIEHHYRLTTGVIRDGRELAVITRGGHPQIPNSGTCEVCTVGWVDEIDDVNVWFAEQVRDSPWDNDSPDEENVQEDQRGHD